MACGKAPGKMVQAIGQASVVGNGRQKPGLIRNCKVAVHHQNRQSCKKNVWNRRHEMTELGAKPSAPRQVSKQLADGRCSHLGGRQSGGLPEPPLLRTIDAALVPEPVRSRQPERQALVELRESQEAASSSRAIGMLQHVDKRSPVLAEVSVDARASGRSPSVRASDELSDEEAEAFFFV